MSLDDVGVLAVPVRNHNAAYCTAIICYCYFVTLLVLENEQSSLLAAYLFFGKEISPLSAVALSMIVSGGVGNMIDRLFRSATDALGNVYYFVVDFIDFTLIDFAVFNGADSFVCVGAGLMILSLFLEMKQEVQKAKAEKTAQEEASKTEEDE